MSFEVFTCRSCRGRGTIGRRCQLHRGIKGVVKLQHCVDPDGDRCEACFCCGGTGDHAGGVCMKDLRGARSAV